MSISYLVRCILAAAIMACASTLTAQTITSTATGGNWDAASTWVGNTVPGQNNDVVINGPVSVTTSAFSCRNLTVNSGGILQNGGSLGWVTLHVYGAMTNNGLLRNNPAGYAFYIELRGDITNNGTWTPTGTYIATKQLQHISQAAGKKFESLFYLSDANGAVDTNGSLLATSALTFTDRFDLHWRSIDMGGNTLTLSAAANFSWGTTANASHIYFNDSSYLYNAIIAGTTTELHGTARIDGNVQFTANIINNDVIQHSGGLGWVTPIFHGDLTNKGTIRNNPVTGYGIVLDLRGDVRNEGTWQPGGTHIGTKKDQHISLTQGKVFDNPFYLSDGNGYADTTGKLIATSPLTFTNEFDLKWRFIDMDSLPLTLSANGHLGTGTIRNSPDIYCRDNSYFANTIVEGNVTLHGSAHMDGNVTFLNDVVVADSMHHFGNLGWVTVTVYGNFTNNGVVSNNPVNNWGLWIRGFKDIHNNGVWTAQGATLDGEGRRNVNLSGAPTQVRVPGAKVIFAGNCIVPTLAVSAGAITYVGSESSLIVEDGTTDYGWNGLGNLGKITIPKKTIAGTTHYDFYSGGVYFPSGASLPDSVIVESFGGQTPASFGNAVARWWRIRTNPSSPQPQLQYLDLYYAQSDLNGAAEKDLVLYRSTDAGKNWIAIDAANIHYRDTNGNYIRIQDVPCAGDYVLAPLGIVIVPSRPNVRVAIVGSTDIRVIAPNRQVINIYNNSDAPSGDLLLQLESNQKLRFLKTEDNMDGSLRIFGINDLGEDSTDQTVSFLLRSLGPREERDFTLYATATSTSIAKGKGYDPQFFWFIGVAAVYIAGAYLEDYVTDKMIDGCFQAWLPANMNESDKALLKQTLSQAMKEQAKKATIATGKQLAEDGAKKVLEHNVLGKLIWPAKMGINILSCIENTIKGMQCYLGQTPIKDVFTHVECNGSQKEVRPVTSRDPNQKSGPNGFGTDNYIARSERMEYMIECENAPDAAAPAYKIVIVDSLAPEYDETSVVFGRTSHAYTATQTGRLLKWEITGIDLPANKVPTEGESWVTYSVLPKLGLASGTKLGNRASITFDANAPIVTNTYVNTLDYEAPTTTMMPLPSHTSDTLVTVKWATTDAVGSGYESAMLYMAKDDGEYLAVGNQSTDSVRMILDLNHSYSFFALARDNVGNLEMQRPAVVSIRVASGVRSLSDDKDFWLRPIYPNPAKSSIAIEYSVTRTGRTTIDVLDELGRTVATVLSASRSEGIYTEAFDCSSLMKGTYYVRLEQGGVVRTQKIALVD